MSFTDIINLGNPSHEQNIKLSDIFLSPIHHLCYTHKLHYVMLPKPPASPFTLAKITYASYLYLYMANCVWYCFSWRYLH